MILKIRQAQNHGWLRKVTVVSNIGIDRVWLFFGRSRRERVAESAAALGAQYIACIWSNLKHKPGVFSKALRWMRTQPEKTIVVDDQTTAIKAGNRIGAYTILVDPLGNDFIGTALMRRLKGEHKLRARLKRER